MKKILTVFCLAALLVPGTSAETNEAAFIVYMGDSTLKSLVPPDIYSDDMEVYQNLYSAKQGGFIELYAIKVTEAQFNAGWGSLPESVKSNSYVVAESYRTVYTNWSAREQSTLDTFLELYNDIAPTGKQLTKDEMIDKVKSNTKKPKKPKKPKSKSVTP